MRLETKVMCDACGAVEAAVMYENSCPGGAPRLDAFPPTGWTSVSFVSFWGPNAKPMHFADFCPADSPPNPFVRVAAEAFLANRMMPSTEEDDGD